MASTPTNYSTPSITRAGTLISELNIVVPRPYNRFIKKYNFTPYMLLTQMTPNGMVKLSEDATENKLFYWYEQFGRQMGFFQAAANVTVANGASATVTVAAGGYSAAGVRSLPEIGMIFYNARTGVESRVSAVNKGTVNAHTAALTPVQAAGNASVLAGDELQFRGFKYVGEASDYTTTLIQNIAKFTNYASQLRKDCKITDLAKAERIDFSFDGQNYFWYKEMEDMNDQLIQEKELMLLDSVLTDNLGYAESGTAGLIQQIQANGINKLYPNFNAQLSFADIERSLDAEGGPMEYDWLADTDQDIDINLSLANEFNNGAIVYKEDDLRRGFKSFTPIFRKFNFTRYTPISERRMYGSSANQTTRNNFGILIPRNTVNVRGDVRVNDAPQMVVRYQDVAGNGAQFVVAESGALSANGKTTKMELVVSQEGYFGLQVNGANQFMIYKKG